MADERTIQDLAAKVPDGWELDVPSALLQHALELALAMDPNFTVAKAQRVLLATLEARSDHRPDRAVGKLAVNVARAATRLGADMKMEALSALTREFAHG